MQNILEQEFTMINNTHKKSLLAFFLLAIILITPFWVLGAIIGIQLLPGIPIAALGTFCPMTAALILVYRERKRAGIIALLKRSFDYKRIKDIRWYIPILLIMAGAMALSFVVQRLMGMPVPIPHITISSVLVLCFGFFLAALGEELGWSGYALDPMQARWGALLASLILGGFWAIYHYVGLVQAHRSVTWIAWWTLYAISIRVIMVWIFNHTGKSVFAMALFHMTINTTWQLFPISGSYFDPRVTGLILAAVAVIVMVIWSPNRRGRKSRTSIVPTDGEAIP